jgi:hypothetical protein
MKLFMLNPMNPIVCKIGEADEILNNPRNINARTMLVKGPARDIFPFCSSEIYSP